MYDHDGNIETARAYSDAPLRESRLMVESAILEKMHAELANKIEMLGERLAPVLQPSVPNEPREVLNAVREPTSPFVQDLQRHANATRGLAARLDDLLSRLEV